MKPAPDIKWRPGVTMAKPLLPLWDELKKLIVYFYKSDD